ncbi:unnamed protein product, partial [Allacma fusca]
MKLYVLLFFVTVFQLGSALIWEDEDAIGIDAPKRRKDKTYDVEVIEGGVDYSPVFGLGYANNLDRDGFCRTRNGDT